MKKIIYYFSGTGNSLYTANKIAQAIGGAELVSVRCNPQDVSAADLMWDNKTIQPEE